MATIRSFVAIPLPERLRRAIEQLQNQLRASLPGVRWANTENLHLTLRFFGDIPQDTLEKIRTSVLSVERWQEPFQVTVQGLGVFPDPHRPRVLWLGLTPTTELEALYCHCQEVFSRAGVAPEKRRFAPHLTIGRFRRRDPALRHILADHDNILVETMTVDRLILYESRLHPRGAEHLPLQIVSLGGE